MSNLTPRQELFVAEYLKDLNATQAAIRAGYSPTSAQPTSSDLLSNPMVAAAVAAGRAKQLERVQIDADFVLRELVKLATSDHAAAFDENGNLRPVHEIPEDTRKAIAGIETFEERDSEGRFLGYTRKVKFWDKNKALENLGRHVSLFKDRVEISVDPSLVDELRAARERAAGFDLV